MRSARRLTNDGATIVLALLALTLFARLTLRHVGDSYFLADQVDHLQKYEAALRLEPEGLWGPAMSGTDARALGPFAAIVFGLPLSLGLGINAIHALTSLLLAVATAIAFWQLLRISQPLAWGWLMVFTAMRIVWWNAAMFWMNTLQLPLGLLLLALFAASLRSPSVGKLLGLALVLLLALHGHLVALVGVPVVLLAAALTGREAFRRPASRATITVAGALLVLAIAPYLFAEAATNFRNTRAIVGHVEAATTSDHLAGREAAIETLVLATDPAVLMTARSPAWPIGVGAACASAALVILLVTRRSQRAPTPSRVLRWLVVAAVTGIAGQAVFFFLMARPLNGLHYVTLLAPWYAIPPAAVIAAVVPDTGLVGTTIGRTLGLVSVLLLVFLAPAHADRYAERTPWTYDAITTALNALCANQKVSTVEGPGLVDELTPSYDSVLQYLMKRGYVRCRYEPSADLAIVARRSGGFDDVIEIGGRRFRREELLPPGIARYRRSN